MIETPPSADAVSPETIKVGAEIILILCPDMLMSQAEVVAYRVFEAMSRVQHTDPAERPERMRTELERVASTI